MEVSAFVTKQLTEQLKQQRQHDDKLRQEMEARLEANDAKMDKQRQEFEAQLEAQREAMKPAPPPTISDDQIAALQARLEGLHDAELLTEEQLDQLEDIVMDYVEAKASSVACSVEVYATAARLSKMVAVSEAVGTDRVFARTAWRRFG